MKVKNKLDHTLIVGNLRLEAGEEVEIHEIDEKIKYALEQNLLEEIKEERREEQPKEENKKETSRRKAKNKR